MVSNKNLNCKDLGHVRLNHRSTGDAKTVKQEIADSVQNRASRRKDTKDSGYGGYSSECEEELQRMPDWCFSYLKSNDNDRAANEGMLCRDKIDDGVAIGDCEDYEGSEKVSDEWDECDVIAEMPGVCAMDKNGENSNERYMKATDESKEIVRDSERQPKPSQRQRRITPIPLSNPLKISFRASPDCMFVEEEDSEDIRSFNLEDEFVDQTFLLLASSPRGSPRLRQRSMENTGKEDVGKNESTRDMSDKPFIMYSRCLSEVTDRIESPETARKHRQELLGRRIAVNSDDQANLGKTVQLPRLYLRSKSENDAIMSKGPRKGHIPTSSLAKCDNGDGFTPHLNIEEETDVVEEYQFEPCSDGKELNMSSKDVPHIELEPASALPDWMREALPDDVTNDKPPSGNMHTKTDGCASRRQGQSVRLRNDATIIDEKSTTLADQAEISDEVIKIYTPQKDYVGKKPKRSRKLTPARATSPSLEKLADLQDQIFAFSVAEQDSD